MAVAHKDERESRFADKEALLRILEEQDQRLGFVFDPAATAERARALIRADGVRPEENLFSRGVLEAREE